LRSRNRGEELPERALGARIEFAKRRDPLALGDFQKGG
jgi:hypothetical protein